MAQLTGNPGMIVKTGPGTGTAVTASVDTTALHQLGTRAYDLAGGEWIYLQGVASTILGSAATYDENGLTTLVVANAIGPVAFAGAAIVANTFGWYCVRSPLGGMLVSTDAGIADNGLVYVDGTAGRVDDTAVTGDRLLNAVFRGTDTSNYALCQFDYPSITDAYGA